MLSTFPMAHACTVIFLECPEYFRTSLCSLLQLREYWDSKKQNQVFPSDQSLSVFATKAYVQTKVLCVIDFFFLYFIADPNENKYHPIL